MQNLLLFLRRYQHVFLFILLEVVCVYAIFSYNVYHQSILLNASNSVSGSILQSRNNVVQYLSLKKENDRLLGENASGYDQSESYQFIFSGDTFVYKDTSEVPVFSFIPARVMNKTVHKRQNYFTINRGVNQGVRENMGVVSQDGVVGIIVNTSNNFSTVMTLLHEDFSLTPRINNEEQFGRLYWTGPDPKEASIDRISKHIDLSTGMEVRSSLFSKYFPPDYKVGYISSLRERPNSTYWDVKVDLSTDFANVRSVYVVRNIFHQELDSLYQNE